MTDALRQAAADAIDALMETDRDCDCPLIERLQAALAQQPAPSVAPESLDGWRLIGPQGQQFDAPTALQCCKAEIDSRISPERQAENLMSAIDEMADQAAHAINGALLFAAPLLLRRRPRPRSHRRSTGRRQAVSNIKELPPVTLQDISGMLRLHADRIDAGEAGVVEAAVLVMEDEWGKITHHGFGRADYYRGMAIMQKAIVSLATINED